MQSTELCTVSENTCQPMPLPQHRQAPDIAFSSSFTTLWSLKQKLNNQQSLHIIFCVSWGCRINSAPSSIKLVCLCRALRMQFCFPLLYINNNSQRRMTLKNVSISVLYVPEDRKKNRCKHFLEHETFGGCNVQQSGWLPKSGSFSFETLLPKPAECS